MICIQGYCSLSISRACHVPSDDPLSETHTPTPKTSACGRTDPKHSSSAFLLLRVGIQTVRRRAILSDAPSTSHCGPVVSSTSHHVAVQAADPPSHIAVCQEFTDHDLSSFASQSNIILMPFSLSIIGFHSTKLSILPISATKTF